MYKRRFADNDKEVKCAVKIDFSSVHVMGTSINLLRDLNTSLSRPCVGIGIQYPKLFGEVFDGLNDNDPVVRMRAADVIEKVTQSDPELLDGYTSQVMAMLVDCTTPCL